MSTKKAYIILGLGYGDEGKGLATDYLSLNIKNAIVVRFNGGQQAGHTVVTKKGNKHIFSNFGSGTFRNIPTYWSSYCSFSPSLYLEEFDKLSVKPKFLIDRLCPVTTHYDVLYNRALERTRGRARYGSCGVGFGATMDRHNYGSIKLFVGDLFDIVVYKRKLQLIRNYYRYKIEKETKFQFDKFDHDNEDERFDEEIGRIQEMMQNQMFLLVNEMDIFHDDSNWDNYIFEGAQGILLDQHFGNNPFITKSNTTSKNAIELIKSNCNICLNDINIYYVTRAYLTRHGSGPFKKATPHLRLKNVNETNVYNDYQGEFKIGYLDIDLLNYSLVCDSKYSQGCNKNLLVTCMDQIEENSVTIYKKGKKVKIHPKEIAKHLNCSFESIKYSYSQCSEDL